MDFGYNFTLCDVFTAANHPGVTGVDITQQLSLLVSHVGKTGTGWSDRIPFFPGDKLFACILHQLHHHFSYRRR